MERFKNHLEYIKNYPSWIHFKKATYYYFRPWANWKLIKEGKSYHDEIWEEVEKQKDKK